VSVNVLFIRFSLLLLEFGEVYFEDFTVVFYPLVTAEAIEEKYVHYKCKYCDGNKLQKLNCYTMHCITVARMSMSSQ